MEVLEKLRWWLAGSDRWTPEPWPAALAPVRGASRAQRISGPAGAFYLAKEHLTGKNEARHLNDHLHIVFIALKMLEDTERTDHPTLRTVWMDSVPKETDEAKRMLEPWQ